MRTCPHCGEEIQGDTSAITCRYCGKPLPPETLTRTGTMPAEGNSYGIASLVLGIIPLWPITSIVALVLGYAAKGQIDRSGGAETGRGMAVAGIVLGWAGIAIWLGAVMMFVLLAHGLQGDNLP